MGRRADTGKYVVAGVRAYDVLNMGRWRLLLALVLTRLALCPARARVRCECWVEDHVLISIV